MSSNESINLALTKEQIDNLILATNWMIDRIIPDECKQERASEEAKEKLLERLEKYKILKELLTESLN
jgi:hypothetical protein